MAKAAVASHRAATNKLDVVALGDMPAVVEVDRDLPGTGVGVAAISRMTWCICWRYQPRGVELIDRLT